MLAKTMYLLQDNRSTWLVLFTAILMAQLLACATTAPERIQPTNNPDVLAVLVRSHFDPFYAGDSHLQPEELYQIQESTKGFQLVNSENDRIQRTLISELKSLNLFDQIIVSDPFTTEMYKPALLLKLTTMWYVRGATEVPRTLSETRTLTDEGMLYEVALIEKLSGSTVYAHRIYASGNRQPPLTLDEPILTKENKSALKSWRQRMSSGQSAE